jgi:diaminobutyrate-2-oxoglutarate transaminase
MRNGLDPVFERLESNVRSYCRDYPATFHRAEGASVFDVNGREYIDFLSGAGALNYGHNHPALIGAVLEYVKAQGVIHSLDMYTQAKAEFLLAFERVVLGPRGLSYKVQFTGPTGTNAVEAALKLARKVTGRSAVVAFTNAYHGVSLGSLATTASRAKRAAAGVQLDRVIRLPYDGFAEEAGRLHYVETMLRAPGSGIDPPAALILETVQGEGGLNVASNQWLQGVARIARQIGALLIVDEIQTGCGRVGGFFDFERAGIQPDIVCVSKSLSGLGLPLSILLIAPEHDRWSPGEHNGTFRGNNLAFVGARAALGLWESHGFAGIAQKSMVRLDEGLRKIARHSRHENLLFVGRGMLRGIEVRSASLARMIRQEAFALGLIVEICGPGESVLKLMPPLNIPEDVLESGLGILAEALARVVPESSRSAAMGA